MFTAVKDVPRGSTIEFIRVIHGEQHGAPETQITTWRALDGQTYTTNQRIQEIIIEVKGQQTICVDALVDIAT